MKNIKYIALLLLLVGCNSTAPQQHDKLNTEMDKLDIGIKNLIQSYDDQKVDIQHLETGMVNMLKPYCKHHKGFKMATTNSDPADYPFQVFCNDGHTLKVYAPSV